MQDLHALSISVTDWTQRTLGWMPSWLQVVIIFAAALGGGLAVHHRAFRLLQRLVRERGLFLRALVARTEGPGTLATVVIALSIASRIAPLTYGQAGVINQMLAICLIALVAWMVQTALQVWMVIYLRNFKLDAEDNLLARKHVTQTRILRQVANFLIVTIAIAAALMTFPGVREYGVSLLASAGAAGIVVGLALQPVLKNLFAGIQLAMTQPIRIEDALLVEGEWGKVEEITSTYVVVRIWDLRRMILPLSYFIEHPFQNWTRDSAELIGTVMLYLDYSTPVPAVRRKAEEIARASPLWNGKVFNLSVTDLKERTMEIRVLVGANDAGRAFDLRCEMREKLMAFLQQEYPQVLPRIRAELPHSETARVGVAKQPAAAD
jgi:small-conductance mechanosensitive channel